METIETIAIYFVVTTIVLLWIVAILESTIFKQDKPYWHIPKKHETERRKYRDKL